MNTKTHFDRAPFSENLSSLRHTFAEILPLLEAQPEWYGSIYFERKSTRNFSANLKQTQMADNVVTGAVFRIYDGFTLFEEATDDLNPKNLKTFALGFAKRVRNQTPAKGVIRRPYVPAKWSDRLSAVLETEIQSQIPLNVSAQTPVHFGIKYKNDPRKLSPADSFENLKNIVDRCKKTGLQSGMSATELTFVQARQSFIQEESIFIDRESNLSQTLFRLSLGLTTMSGGDRTFCRLGGLGGTESIQLEDTEISRLIENLKSLKSAERLVPGRYRVLFGPVLSGVLAHEAFGHAQEGDTCARGRSKAWELHQTGELVGNQHATILNNPAVYENGGEPYAAWGSYFFDEEGWLAQEQVLLDKGKLLAPMTNLTSALRLGVSRTANGKRETWANGVYTRQTNTYFSAGDKTLDELMATLSDGYLALDAAGGMEDPKGMGIQVGISFLQEVKNGKLTGRYFKGPAGGDIQLTGYTPEVLNSIIAKSKIEFTSKEKDLARHPFNDVGGCGKYHKEFVFAGCGGPYMVLDQVTLG